MRVVRPGHFERQVAAELDIEGRPSVEQFEDQLAPIADLVFSAFWEDPTLVPPVDDESGIRITLIAPPAPYMFPPSVFYSRQVDTETIEMIGVDFNGTTGTRWRRIRKQRVSMNARTRGRIR